MSPVTRADVLVRCDIGTTVGVGHLMRCVALAEELLARGLSVLFCADVSEVPLARRQLESRGIAHVPAVQGDEAHAALVREVAPSLVVVDSYLLPPSTYDAMRGHGAPLLAFVDGDLGGRVADIYLDQNIGAELDRPELPAGAVRLAGLRYALMRDEILASRPREPRREPGRETRHDPARVFAVFGGTDAFGAAPVVAGLLVRTGLPFDAVMVAGNPSAGRALEAVPLGARQRLRVIEPTDRVAERVVAADVVLSASGTSTWELACLGAAAGLVCVADNQVQSYHRMLATGTARGLGLLGDLRAGRPEAVACAVTALDDLLRRPEERERLREAAWRTVDGGGRSRVADAMLGRGVTRLG